MKKLLAVPVAALLCSGCIPSAARVDPFADLPRPQAQAQNGAFKKLTLAVVASQNTKNSASSAAIGKFLSMGAYPDQPWAKVVAMLKERFKDVYGAKSYADAKTLGADVVAVFDYYSEEPAWIWSYARVDAALAFVTPEGAPVDTVRGKADVKGSEGEGILGQTRMANAIRMSQERALTALAAALDASRPLAALAGGAPSPATLAAAPAAPSAPPSDIDEPSYHRPEDPNKFAVVVGIERYESLPAADFAEHDAQAVRKHLRALGYPDRNVIVLTGAQAGRAGIEKYVESWLPRNVGPDGQLLFFFSGHGAPDPASGRAYLVPWDGDPKFLENTGYPLGRLYEKLNGLKAKQVVVALDSCFSGAGGRSVLAQGARPLVNRIETAPSGRVAVLSASAGDEITGTASEQGHGLFTYYLLKSLNARRGAGTLDQIFADLRPKVQDAARRDNREQTPQLAGGDGLRL